MTHGRWHTVAVQLWAAAGVVFLFAEAAWRLALRGIAAVSRGLQPFEWLALVLLTAAFVYGEGVRALQRRWVPWVLERIERLPAEQSLFYRVAAPLYAMSLVGPSRGAVLRAWAGVAAIVAAVLIVSRFPHPWRGIVDTAVAAALIWGAIALVRGAVRILRAGSRGS
ncbi:MAG TPA: hypothetical protein VHG09_00085 [Longimicrobiales bacterium]|nr:hypothetical protein [Longimicrobiales bacterium]